MENLKAIIVFLLFWSIVIWAVDVGCGYVQKAKGKESKRISETASDAFLDFIKQ